jgi:hypothetical protein
MSVLKNIIWQQKYKKIIQMPNTNEAWSNPVESKVINGNLIPKFISVYNVMINLFISRCRSMSKLNHLWQYYNYKTIGHLYNVWSIN